MKWPVAAISILIVLAACKAGPNYEPPKAPEVTSAAGFEAGPGLRGAEPVADWWSGFEDPKLESLVARALEANKDLEAAVARVREARAILRETGLDRAPTVDSNAGYTRQRLSNAGIQGQLAERTLDTYQAGFDALWELDLFGRVTRRIQGARARADAAQADLDATYTLVAAETGRTYVELRGNQYALNVAERNRDNQQETLRLTERLRDGGRATELDVSRARTQLQLTEASIPPLKAAIEAAINRLGVLTADGREALLPSLSEPEPLPSLPEWVAVGDAESLLRRRADIRSAERQLAAATADYGLATAELYPNVSLVGTLGFQSMSFSSFGDSGTDFFSIGPSITWPAFNLGRVRARIRQADARAQGALAQFEQQVLVALEEVQTALSNFAQAEERRASLVEAASSSAAAARIARLRFDQGLDGFLDVLDAERVQLDAERQLADSETLVATNLVAVYKALGGGWQVIPQPR